MIISVMIDRSAKISSSRADTAFEGCTLSENILVPAPAVS